MFTLVPVSDRVQRLRQRYRDTIPALDAERVRLITESYKASENDLPIIRRAKAVAAILDGMTLRVEEDELLVSNMAATFRGAVLWPEFGGIDWLIEELDSGKFDSKGIKDGFMYMTQEDRDYVHSVQKYWQENSVKAKVEASLPPELSVIGMSGVAHDTTTNAGVPGAHLNANFRKVVERGFGSIRDEAKEKLEEMKGDVSCYDCEKYFFYNAVVICCEAAIRYAKRYAAVCLEAAEKAESPRKEELLAMADTLNNILDKPARSYRDALQAVLLYETIIMLEGNYLGMTPGRFDQHVGDYLEADLANGVITEEEAQELLDCFFLKTADLFFSAPEFLAHIAGAYSNNIRLTIGGRKPEDGSDATNKVTYMCLQSSARLRLHDPNLSLGVHKDTPPELLEAAIEVSKIVFGVPCIENCDLIINALLERGFAIEDARNYCIIGCVEISGSGCDWPNVSGPFSKTWVSVTNVLLNAINNGINPQNGVKAGLDTGYLYEMSDFEQVMDAFEKQLDYFMKWYHTINNIMDHVGTPHVQSPMVSCSMDGCMESGKDMMMGGAKYNGIGTSTLGIGTAADSLATIKYMVFDKKFCTARELYDAFMANWEGHELLRQQIMRDVPHYGNGDSYVDDIAARIGEMFTSRVDKMVSTRGRHNAGIYSAGAHIPEGYRTYATPNGRKNGEPLSDAASPSQGCDLSGPFSVVSSILKLEPKKWRNGMQFNMKFHPSAVRGTQGTEKMKAFVNAFIAQGGMQLQYNIVDSDTLRAAQANPEEYRDLVVRVAGFSAYFVELYEDMQNDLISKNEIMM